MPYLPFSNVIFKIFHLSKKRYFLQERKMEFIYQKTAIFRRKQRRRLVPVTLSENIFTLTYSKCVGNLEVKVSFIIFLSQAMAEKIERMELDFESRDKVNAFL